MVAESSEARGRFEAWCTVDGVEGIVPWSVGAAPQATVSSPPKTEEEKREPVYSDAESRERSDKVALRLNAVAVRPAKCSTLEQAVSKAPSIDWSKKVFLFRVEIADLHQGIQAHSSSR